MEVGTQKFTVSTEFIVAWYIINEMVKMTDPSSGEDWPLYKSHLPDGPRVKTDAGAIYDTVGTQEMRGMHGKVPIHPGFQLRIRSRDKETGYAMIEDIARDLDDIFNASFTIGAVNYLIQNFSRTSPIVPLGIEPGTKRRFHFTVNYILTISITN